MIQYIQWLQYRYVALTESTDDRQGQGLVEYVLILGFIAIVVIVALVYFQTRLTSFYSYIAGSIPT